mmetsp:Transcript_91591/g.222502  ORF Transcript_91591/g.222502 Transcript_91591/m.222502 type:complete len:223 (-) Transcript_91591:330-998(-)
MLFVAVCAHDGVLPGPAGSQEDADAIQGQRRDAARQPIKDTEAHRQEKHRQNLRLVEPMFYGRLRPRLAINAGEHQIGGGCERHQAEHDPHARNAAAHLLHPQAKELHAHLGVQQAPAEALRPHSPPRRPHGPRAAQRQRRKVRRREREAGQGDCVQRGELAVGAAEGTGQVVLHEDRCLQAVHEVPAFALRQQNGGTVVQPMPRDTALSRNNVRVDAKARL